MYKKILLLIVLFSFTVNAQDTIRGKMNPAKNYSYIILNQLNSVNKKYMNNAVIKNGEFKMAVPKGSAPGMYRLEYDVNNNLFIDFIYNKEDVELEFNPERPEEEVKFTKSVENKLYQGYIDEIAPIQNKLDAAQVSYFQEINANQVATYKKVYAEQLTLLRKKQAEFISKSKGKLAHAFIKANTRYYNENLIKDTDVYLKDLKKHYYDNIDFNSPELAKSSIIVDRVMDYIIYLTQSKDTEKLKDMRKQAVTESLNKITNVNLKSDLMQSIIYMFAQQEELDVTDYIFKNHFSKLPIGLQNLEFKNMIYDMFKTTIGQPAPDIKWTDLKGKFNSLNTLNGADYYVVVFWSSTCSHCLKDIPKLDAFLNNRNDIKTIAIGLEDENSKGGWKEETFFLENITHVLGLGKWKSKYAKDYGVTSTPSYYVLDRNKTIVAKPYDFEKLEALFKSVDSEKK